MSVFVGVNIFLWGRKAPSNFGEAYRNIKVNMKSAEKILRVVTSLLLGAAGMALVSFCKVCNEDSSFNTNSTLLNATGLNSASINNTVALNSTGTALNLTASWQGFDIAGKVCLVAGGVYGFAGVFVVITTLAGKIIIPCHKSCSRQQDSSSPRERRRICMNVLKGFIPEFMAGALGSVYGCVTMPMLQLELISSPVMVAANTALGYGSSGFYLLDAAIGCYDLSCSDIFEAREEEEKQKKPLSKEVKCFKVYTENNVQQGHDGSMTLISLKDAKDKFNPELNKWHFGDEGEEDGPSLLLLQDTLLALIDDGGLEVSHK
ncbi:hypothetical protein CLAVI_000580 [Candidatus Clavichlamydia salmonicola]|uniref:hypothetical protein n=1 Tax=Candidatus Clavichlamydia salmonicola TaxID=469812 RepID=UPI001891F230|nr:hypothetical protein [Candidatus Clavichlamydia salmonicola]MBF5050957.1 hypothetical protein [Candidatus Clavichlamydia salmonicola]